jgi:hypothetical protein
VQGLQHFRPYSFKGGKERFYDDIERDERKKKLCEEHNVPPYYINYNENIESKLKEILTKS